MIFKSYLLQYDTAEHKPHLITLLMQMVMYLFL